MWFKLMYTLPVNEGSKPETVALQAENESEAKTRITEHFIKKCHNVFGEPTIVGVEQFESFEEVKESIGGMNE